MSNKSKRRYHTDNELLEEIDRSVGRINEIRRRAQKLQRVACRVSNIEDPGPRKCKLDRVSLRILSLDNSLRYYSDRLRRLRNALGEFRTQQLPCCVDDGSVVA